MYSVLGCYWSIDSKLQLLKERMGGAKMNIFFLPFINGISIMCCLKIQCEFWCTKIIQHISGFSFHSQVFRLTTKVLFFWCQPSPKNPTTFIYPEIITAHEYFHRKNQFFPSWLWPKYASCFANLRIWDSWSQDSWCLLPRLYSYHAGSITYHFHEQIPCTRCRWAHSNSQGWKGMFFQTQPHLPGSSALGKMHWSEPERMGFLLIFYQPLGIAPSHN